jgi:MarR family transcriptional regulator, negative regulator of the multidrug operon emrRAB
MAPPFDDDRLVNLLGALAVGLYDAAVGDVAAHAALDGTASAALVVLLDLARSGSVQALSRLVGLSHSGTVRLVNRLAEAGLVERRPGPDAHTIAVRLTRRGRAAAVRIRAGRHAAIVAALTGLTGPQREQLAATCELLIANLTAGRLAQRDAGGQPSGGALCRMCDPVACGRLAGNCPAARMASSNRVTST